MPQIEPLRVYQNSRPGHTPNVGDQINLDVPGERMRAEVKGVAGERLVVEILSTPVGKSGHGYMKGDLVNAQRGEDSIGQECWKVISEREMRNAEMRAKLAEEQAAKEAEAEAERIAAIRARDLAAQAKAPQAKSAKPKTRKPAARARKAKE